MLQYRAREDNVDTTDTKSLLNDLGANADSDITVPASPVSRIITASAGGLDTAAKHASLLRVEGDGLPSGPYVFAGNARGAPVATGNTYSVAAIQRLVDFPATPGQAIQVFGERLGEDTGPVDLALCLGFGTIQSARAKKTFVLEGEMTAADANVTLTTQGSVAAPVMRSPPNISQVASIAVGWAASFDAAAVQGTVFLKLSGSAFAAEQQIVVGAFGGAAVQATADPTANGFEFVLEDASLPCKPSEDMTIQADMSADPGDATIVVELGFA